MKEFKGTKGKWKKGIVQSIVISENGNEIADIYAGSNSRSIVEYTVNDIKEVEANAQLIAAAPDLLEVLMWLNDQGGHGLKEHAEMTRVINKALGIDS